MLPDLVSNPGPLTYESRALRIALRGQVSFKVQIWLSLQNLMFAMLLLGHFHVGTKADF